MLKLDVAQTLAFGAVVLLAGYLLRRIVPILGRYNIPAPVVGGLLVSVAVLIAQQYDVELFQFDLLLRDPLMIAFFTTIGFGASLSLLKQGGPQVAIFFSLSVVAAVLQNVVGGLGAIAMGQSPLFGVLCGSVTLTGGPATGLAFAPQFEAAGVTGAESIAVAAAMAGIVSGGLIGAPIGTLLIERLRSGRGAPGAFAHAATAAQVVEERLGEPAVEPPSGEDAEAYVLLKSVGAILVAMWAGSWVSAWIGALGVTLPAYIGAMLVAAGLRNIDDLTGWFGLSQRTLDDLGNVALSFFLVISLMTLELWKLTGVALPLLVIVALQVILVGILSVGPLFLAMGRDYEAAVMGSGFCGFMMGTTANAMANMDALVQRYGAAPRAFLVVPMVGAFFIDFANALLVQVCLNYLS
jgi:ESS family glutamate:Na+ symporter